MDEPQTQKPNTKQDRDNRREETTRAFKAIKEAERKARLEKDMRLRSMRLLKD